MTKNCFSARVYDRVGVAFAGLVRCSYFDYREECRVVRVNCWECGKEFSEELGEAKLKVARRQNLVCLSCDEVAAQSSMVRVVGV